MFFAHSSPFSISLVDDIRVIAFSIANTISPPFPPFRAFQTYQYNPDSWAFSAIQALEAANAITNGQLYDLSEQQLVDCSGPTGNEGCNGGLMNNAYDYLISAGGSCQTKDYPYTGRDGSCKKCTPSVVVKGYDTAPSGNDGLAKTLQRGPVAVALAATSSFQFYSYVIIPISLLRFNLPFPPRPLSQ